MQVVIIGVLVCVWDSGANLYLSLLGLRQRHCMGLLCLTDEALEASSVSVTSVTRRQSRLLCVTCCVSARCCYCTGGLVVGLRTTLPKGLALVSDSEAFFLLGVVPVPDWTDRGFFFLLLIQTSGDWASTVVTP